MPFQSKKQMKSKKLQHAGRLLLAVNTFPSGCSQQLSDSTLSIMVTDSISCVVKSDETILRVGSTLIENRGNEKAVAIPNSTCYAQLLLKRTLDMGQW